MTAGKAPAQAGPSGHRPSPPSHQSSTAKRFYEHASANRISTEAVIAEAVRAEYPELHLNVVLQRNCNLLAFAGAGHAGVTPIDKEQDRLSWRLFIPPAKRLYGSGGLFDDVKLGKFLLEWKGREYIIYVVSRLLQADVVSKPPGQNTDWPARAGRFTRRHQLLLRHHTSIRAFLLADCHEQSPPRSRQME